MDALTRKAYELRRDIIEMVHNSRAGHVGGDLSVTDILTVLYFKVMNVSPEKPTGYLWLPGPAYLEKVSARFPFHLLSR